MQYSNLSWCDGHPYSEMFDDIYYSSSQTQAGQQGEVSGSDGRGEFEHVFFNNNDLAQRWAASDRFTIAELGLGSALNCLLTIEKWLQHCEQCDQHKTLHFVTIEKYPLSPETIRQLVCGDEQFNRIRDEFLQVYPPAVETTHIRRLFAGRVVLHFKFMDVLAALQSESLNVDAWYLDGFSPAKNAGMWSAEVFSAVAANSRPAATCSSYTAAGFVRRNLQAAGFDVNKVPGYGRKRDMLTARLAERQTAEMHYQDKPWFTPPPARPGDGQASNKQATVLGAGVAGLTLAYALIQRGWQVTVIDKTGDDMKRASDNLAAIVYPRLSTNSDTDSEFYIAAYCYALHYLKALQQKAQLPFFFDDGLLQHLERSRAQGIIDRFQFNQDFVSLLAAGGEQDGKEDDSAALHYADSGVVLPQRLSAALIEACGDKLSLLDARVSRVKRSNRQWQCYSNGVLVDETDCLLLANGTGINQLGLPLDFPVDILRGQMLALKENACSAMIKQASNASVYITPLIEGRHYLGGTYSRENTSAECDEADTEQLLSCLDELYPGYFSRHDVADAWVGFRTIAKDRVAIAGAVPDADFFRQVYADIRHGNKKKCYPVARYLDGLYISAAHGSHGFTNVFLLAEMLAAQIEGEPSPVSRRVQDYLSASRFIVNDLKRG